MADEEIEIVVTIDIYKSRTGIRARDDSEGIVAAGGVGRSSGSRCGGIAEEDDISRHAIVAR